MLAANRWLGLLTWLTALILLVIVYIRLPLATLPEVLSHQQPLRLFCWMLLNGFIILALTYRWQILVAPLNQTIRFMPLLMVRQAGQVVSFITPGPQFGGEPLQVYWLWKAFGIPGHLSVLAVGLDRFYELWVNFAVLVLALILLGYVIILTPEAWMSALGLMLTFILLLSLIAWVLIKFPDRIGGLIERIATRWQQVPALANLGAVWSRIHTDLTTLLQKHRQALMRALLMSVIGWVGMGLELWILLSFFEPVPTFSGFVLLFVAVRLAFLLPIPGGLGTLEAAVLWAGQLQGLSGEAAMGLIVLMRVRDVIIMGCGMLALKRLNRLAAG